MATRKDVHELACLLDVCVRDYSPGDGVTRYRFFTCLQPDANQDYFGPHSGDYTSFGAAEAMAFLQGFGYGHSVCAGVSGGEFSER